MILFSPEDCRPVRPDVVLAFSGTTARFFRFPLPADGGDQRNAGGELAFSDIPQRVFRGNAAVLGNEQLQIAGRAGTVLIQGNRFGTTGGIDGGGL